MNEFFTLLLEIIATFTSLSELIDILLAILRAVGVPV
jgi:hypothetical protein